MEYLNLKVAGKRYCLRLNNGAWALAKRYPDTDRTAVWTEYMPVSAGVAARYIALAAARGGY